MSSSSSAASARPVSVASTSDGLVGTSGAALVLDEAPLCWMRPGMVGATPPARGGHAAAMVGNLMLVHGGNYYYRGKFFYLGDLWALDADARPMKWHKPRCAGASSPGPRYGSTLTSFAPAELKCLAFGGRGENGLLYNDLWQLDVEKWSWEVLPSTSAPPSPRLGHAAVAVGARLLVCGGWDGKGAGSADFLWLYDRETVSWMRPRCTGIPPSPRQGHSCVFDAASGRLVVLNGCGYGPDGSPKPVAELRELDLRTMVWSRGAAGGDAPGARYWSGCAAVANCAVIFGGWRGPEEYTGKPNLPPGEEEEREGSAHGGGGGGRTATMPHQPGMGYGSESHPGATITVPYAAHADTYLMDMESRECVRPRIAGAAPGYRYGATLVPSGGLSVISFGGWEDGRALNETLVLDLSALAPSQQQEEAE